MPRAPTHSLSRSAGAAAGPVVVLLLVRYLAGAARIALPSWTGAMVAAALVTGAGLGLAPWIGRRLGAARPVRTAGLVGALMGVGAALVLAALLWTSGGAHWPAPAPARASLLAEACLAAALGYAQEAFVRGAAFGTLAARAGAAAAVYVSAGLLAAADLVWGAGLLAALATAALGVWLGFARVRTGGWSYAAGAHAAWNVVLGPVLGIGGENLGAPGASLLSAHLGAGWWAGTPGTAQGGLAALLVTGALAAWALRAGGPPGAESEV